jgi:hypothetical protein
MMGARRVAAASLGCAAVLFGARCAGPPGEAPPNLALGRPAALAGGQPAAAVTDGRLLPEAAPPADPGAVALAGVGDALVVDLGAPQEVAALLLQAGAADTYFVELSSDGAAWQVAWRAPPLPGAAGLFTRTRALARPHGARYLRVRSTTALAAAVSELQAFGSAPAAWPALDRGARGAHRPLWPGLTRERLATLFAALGALLLLATAGCALARRLPASARERRLGRGVLLAVAAAALAAWPNFLNFHYYGFVHTWEFFHYFMGAKYLPELGYSRLYVCAAAVDAEDGVELGGRLMRDLRDNRLVPAEQERERAAQCRSRFSAERWEQFGRDARYFRKAMGDEGWLGVRQDHGFNGTPAWAVLGGLLSRLGPASPGLLAALALIDVALVLASLALIARGFGLEAAALAAGFWGVNALAPFGWTGGGFLRFDWVFWLVAGIAALRGSRPALGGFALGCAALLRVFPGVALAGVALKAVAEAVAARSLAPLRAQARVAAGAAAALVVFGGASALLHSGPGVWRDFASNSVKHRATVTTNLLGVEAFFAYDPEGGVDLMADPLLLDRHAAWKARVAASERQTRPVRWLAAALAALLLAVAARGAPAWAAAVLGLGLMPMWFVLSSYYYCALVAFAALWPVLPAVGVALAALAWASHVIAGLWPEPDAQHAVSSLAVIAFVMGVIGALAWRSARGRAPWDGAP